MADEQQGEQDRSTAHPPETGGATHHPDHSTGPAPGHDPVGPQRAAEEGREGEPVDAPVPTPGADGSPTARDGVGADGGAPGGGAAARLRDGRRRDGPGNGFPEGGGADAPASEHRRWGDTAYGNVAEG